MGSEEESERTRTVSEELRTEESENGNRVGRSNSVCESQQVSSDHQRRERERRTVEILGSEDGDGHSSSRLKSKLSARSNKGKTEIEGEGRSQEEIETYSG